MRAAMAVLCGLALAAGLSACQSADAAKAQQAGLRITEVMTSNSTTLREETLGSPDWIELYNGTGQDVNLKGYSLTDNLEKPKKFEFGNGILQSGAYLLVYAEKDAPEELAAINAGFGLSKAGETLYLLDPYYETVQELDVPALETDVSYAARADGSYGFTALPTPGSANADGDIAERLADALAQAKTQELTPMDGSDPVRISEVLVHNRCSATDGDGDRGEWVELHNSAAEAVTLKDYYLSDRAADPYKWVLPEITMEAGEYRLVFLSGKNRKEGELHASFRLSEADDGLVTLTNRAAGRIDTQTYPADVQENVSVGRDAAGALIFYGLPTPGYENAKGFATADTVSFFDMDGVYISEVQATVVREKKRTAEQAAEEWIELYNGGDAEIALTGWTLEAGIDAAAEKTLALSGALGAGEYRVLGLGETGLKLSGSGETLLLRDDLGRLRDVFSTGAQQTGGSSGRTDGQRRYYSEPTPGAANGAGYLAYTAVPVLSETGLYHTEPFELTMTCRTAGAVIRYTLDGSAPTESSAAYTAPISVSENTVVRAAAFLDGFLSGGDMTATYLFTQPHTVPVYCFAAEPEEMTTILYRSAKNYRPEYRTEVCIYTAEGALGARFSGDTRIRGNGSASKDYSQKSLICHLRGDYGQKTLTYPLFSDDAADTVTAFVLRNSAQDRLSTRLRDAYCSTLALEGGLRAVTSRTRLVVAYCNAKYCGLYYLTEQLNEDYFAARTGVAAEEIDIVDQYHGTLSGTNAGYKEARLFAAFGKTKNDAEYEKLAALVDVDSTIDFVVAKTFLPDYDLYNHRFWRAGPEDTWHRMYIDNDRVCKPKASYVFKALPTYFKVGPNMTGPMLFQYGFRKNTAWRERFVERYVELAVTAYSDEKMMALLERMTAELEPEMPRQIERWGLPVSMEEWYAELATFRERLLACRENAFSQLQKEFDVSDARLAELIEKYEQGA